MNNKKYLPRIIDKLVEQHLIAFGAICIEGAKWCGNYGSTSIMVKHGQQIYIVKVLYI